MNKKFLNKSGSTALTDFEFKALAYPYDSGASQSLTSVGFQPDLVWIKSRTYAYSWQVYDSIRTAGNDKALFLSEQYPEGSTASEGDAQQYGYLSAFDSSGFTVNSGTTNGNYVGTGATSQNIASWHWKASNSTVSNGEGSITSTVSASNGFSIVKYQGNATSGATVGHGFTNGQAPNLMIVKNMDATTNWRVYNSAVSDSGDKFLSLNNTDAIASATVIWNDTAPTSTVFSIGNDSSVNTSGEDYIAYCFQDIAGKLKIGTFEGNNPSAVTVGSLGFTPDFVMMKNIDSVANWYIFDTARDTSNPRYRGIYPDDNSGENTNASTGNKININTNEFVINGSGGDGTNKSGDTFIYMAIKNT